MSDDFDFQGAAGRRALRPENRPHGGHRDHGEHHGGNDGPENLETRVAMHLLGLTRLAGAAAEPEQHPQQHCFGENEDDRSQNDQQPEQIADIPVEVRSMMEDRIRVLRTPRDQRGECDRQRGVEKPTRAGISWHAVSL